MKRILLVILVSCLFVYGLYSSYSDIGYFYEDINAGANYAFVKSNVFFLFVVCLFLCVICLAGAVVLIKNGGRQPQRTKKQEYIGLALFMPFLGIMAYAYFKSEDSAVSQAADKGYMVCEKQRGDGRKSRNTYLYLFAKSERLCGYFKDVRISVKEAEMQHRERLGR